MFFISTSLVNANESYDYTHTGAFYKGSQIEGITSTIFTLNNNGKELPVYCMDYNYLISSGHNYSILNIEDASYIDKNVVNNLSNIVNNAYPFVNIEHIRQISGIEDLKEEDAVAGAQAAIWHFANGYNFYLENNSKLIYDFYLSLKNDNLVSTDIIVPNIITQTFEEDGKINVLIKTDSQNIYNINYSFNQNLESEYGANIENNYGSVLIENLPIDATFTVTLNASQNINKGVYFFYPNGGESSSQSLIGVNSGVVNVSNKKQITISTPNEEAPNGKIKIIKENEKGEKLDNIYFDLYKSEVKEENLIKTNIITNENGEAIIKDIAKGEYILVETKTKEGYVLNNEQTKITVKSGKTTEVKIINETIKNGTLIIKKINPEENIHVKGSTIGVYKDAQCSELLKTVKSEGKNIIVNNLEPGTYCVKEISSPEGYIINLDERLVEVKENEKQEVTIFNHKIYNTGSNNFLATSLLLLLLTSIILGYNLCL